MNKFLKWVLAAVGLVAVFLVIAAVVLPMVIDPNNYKDEISAAVLKETGRELTIGGDIKWTVFPSVGLGLSDVRLGNRDGFGDEPMFDIGEAEVSVKLMPLFSKKVEIGKVNLSDVSIKLRRKVDGETNWQDLGDSSADSTTSTAGGADQDSFMISGVEISNANVSLDDVDQTTELKNFDLTASNIKLGQPFDLKGSFSIKLAEPELTGDVDFSGLIQTAANGKRFGIDGLQISFKGVEGSGADSVSLDAKISANTDIDLTQDKATLSDFSFALHDLLVSGDLDVTSLSTEPQFAGKLSVAEFNPKSFMQAMGMESPKTNNGAALTQLRADMSFAGSSTSADMQNLTLNLDDSLITGRFRVDDFERPKLAFDFKIDQLNLDDYSAPESTAVAGQASEGAEASDLSVDDFRGFTGGGDFRIGKLIVSGLTATNVTTSMTSNGVGVRFYPVNADFYGGKHEGDIKIDAKGKQPILSANLGLTGVQAAGFLEDLTGTASLLGTGDFFLQIQSDVSNSDSTMQTLSGDMGMSVLNGSIVGIDVTKTLSLVSSAMGQQKDVSVETEADQKTEFAELSLSGVFTQGVFNSSDLIMQSPLLRSTGNGSFNLVDETIDYVLEPVLIGDSGVQSLDKLSGVVIPIRLSGNLYEPDYMVDIVALIAASQKDLIDQKKNELIDKLFGGKDTPESETEDGEAKPQDDAVKSLLDGLLGGKKNKGEDKDKDGNQP